MADFVPPSPVADDEDTSFHPPPPVADDEPKAAFQPPPPVADEDAPLSAGISGSDPLTPPKEIPTLSPEDARYKEAATAIAASQLVLSEITRPYLMDWSTTVPSAEREQKIREARTESQVKLMERDKLDAYDFEGKYLANMEAMRLEKQADTLAALHLAATQLEQGPHKETPAELEARKQEFLRAEAEKPENRPGVLASGLMRAGAATADMVGGVIETLKPGNPISRELRNAAGEFGETASFNKSIPGQIAQGVGSMLPLATGNPAGVGGFGVFALKAASETHNRVLRETGDRGEADRQALASYGAVIPYLLAGKAATRLASEATATSGPITRTAAQVGAATGANAATTAIVHGDYSFENLGADLFMGAAQAMHEYARAKEAAALPPKQQRPFPTQTSLEEAPRIPVAEETAPVAEPVSEISTIVPAVRVGGEVIRGNKGETHQDIMARLKVEEPQKWEEAIGNFDSKENPNFFVNGEGKEISRAELKDRFGAGDSQKLRELQAAEPQRNLGPGAANVEEFSPPEPVGAWNAKVDEQRAQRGLSPLASEGRTTDEKAWDAADQRMTENPNYASNLVDSLNAGTKENVNVVEQAALLREIVSLRVARDEATIRSVDEQTYSPEERAAYKEEARMAEERLARTEEADRKAGTPNAQALRFRRMMAYEDFTLGGLMGKAQRAGHDPTPAEIQQWKADAEAFKKHKDTFEKEQTDGEPIPVDEAVRRIEIEAAKDPAFTPEVKSLADRIIARLEKAAEGSNERIRGLMSKLGTQLSVGGDVATGALLVKELAVRAALEIGKLGIKTTAKFAEWGTKMTREFGKGIEPYLRKAWDKANEMTDEAAGMKREKVSKEATPKEDSKLVEAQRRLDSALVERERMDQLLAGEIAPAKKLSREALTDLENDVRAEIAAMRELAAEKRREQSAPTEGDKAQQALNRALAEKERIEGLLTGEIEPTKAEPKEALSQMEEDIQLEIQSLRKVLAEQNAKPKADPLVAQENAQVKALEKAAAEYERRLNEADFTDKGKRQGADTERVAKARALRDAAKTALEAAKKLANPPRTKEQMAYDRYIKFAERKSAEMQAQIDSGDFSAKAKKPALDITKNPKAMAARAAMVEIQNRHARLQQKWREAEEWKKKNVAQKIGHGIFKAWQAIKNSKLSQDISSTIQTGFAIASHPWEGTKAIGGGLRAFFETLIKGQSKFADRLEAEALEDANNKNGLFKQAGLDLRFGETRDENATSVLEKLSDLETNWAGVPDIVKGLMNLRGKQIASGATQLLKTPVKMYGRSVKASNEGYQAIANTMRRVTMNAILKNNYSDRVPTPQELKLLGNFVNAATGSGGLKGKETVGRSLLFAPNWYLSNIKLMTLQPLVKAGYQGQGKAAKAIAKEYVRAIGTLGVLLGARQLFFGDDRKNKLRKDELFDPSAGSITLPSGVSIDLTQGRAAWLSLGARLLAGGGNDEQGRFRKQNPDQIFLGFMKGRMSQELRTVFTALGMKDFRGKELTPAQFAKDVVTPLTWRDLGKILKAEGYTKGSFLQLLNFIFGNVKAPREK